MSMRSRSRSPPMVSVCVCMQLDDLGGEIESGGILRERAAGEDLDVAGDIGAHAGEWNQAFGRAAVGNVLPEILECFQARRFGNLRARTAIEAAVDCARQCVARRRAHR